MDVSASPSPAASAPPLASNLLVPRKPLVDDARFDITAMVDLVFMMNIYFLVTWIVAALAEIDLPAASHCVPADNDTSVVFTITTSTTQPCVIYSGEPQPDAVIGPTEVEQRVGAAVEAGLRENKTAVLIKAEKNVLLRDVVRVANAATASKSMTKLYMAVMEKK